MATATRLSKLVITTVATAPGGSEQARYHYCSYRTRHSTAISLGVCLIRASPINSLDILIVDGGATSCGVALDVFIRGLHVDLVEHEDFSSVSVSLCSSSVGYVSLRSIRLHQSLFVFISWLPLICLSAIKASLCSLVSNPKPFQIWTVRSCPRTTEPIATQPSRRPQSSVSPADNLCGTEVDPRLSSRFLPPAAARKPAVASRSISHTVARRAPVVEAAKLSRAAPPQPELHTHTRPRLRCINPSDPHPPASSRTRAAFALLVESRKRPSRAAPRHLPSSRAAKPF
ncbi:glycerol-3-phosphate dehydrogenase SDP6 [Cucumis melo var. makuwa]|uniref:Glycerol-3-phosphate dehydrogenase SDP6 n=1 Tax=Cucumis melo var. makuwa TaxID=1194695 RepID=A0A5A7U7I5_CUCMM|nr:glycerol-3-phosphate dehydrogenase SDP6 [Cucumis melo var. makuwa]TYK06391.1 glycerol-3-phosphate dehydrogenase SDP6 [Cucumis melo var. makuwa]